jgi:signal transduction histidine kinase
VGDRETFDAVIETDTDFVVTGWDGTAESVYGWRADEALGRPLAEVVPTEIEGQSFEDATDELLRRGCWTGLVTQTDRGGARLPILGAVLVRRDAAGEVLGFRSENRPLGDTARAVERMARAERQARALAELAREIAYAPTAPDAILDHLTETLAAVCGGVVLAGLDGGFLARAPRPASIRGSSIAGDDAMVSVVRAAMEGGPMRPGIGAYAGRALEERRTVVANGLSHAEWLAGLASWFQPFGQRLRVRGVVSVPLVFRASVVGVLVALRDRDFDGHEVGFLQTAADQAAVALENARLRSEAEEAIRVAAGREAELAHAVEDLEAFVYSLTHDLRASLRTIDAFSGFLVARIPEGADPELVSDAERIRSSVTDLQSMSRDLMTLYRVNRREVVRVPCDVGMVARQILESLAHEQPEREVEWAVACVERVDCDPGLLHLALRNLLENAWKYSGEQAAARIRISVGADAVIRIEDNGVGLPADRLERVFKPFERLHAASRFPGTGIGLAIVDRIARRHGGRAWAEQADPCGAVFCLRLGAEAVGDAAGD